MSTGQYSDPPAHQLRVLLHSRTVLEGEDCVATGVISYIEGDLLDVELPEFERFQLSERVKVTVYSPVGIHTFMTVILARHKGAVLLVYPPNQLYKFSERREYPRILIRRNGFVNSFVEQDGSTQELRSPIPMHLHDISLNGVGFELISDISLFESNIVRAELDLGFTLPCEIQVKRSLMKDGKPFFGASISGLNEVSIRGLRAFILKEQITAYTKSRNQILRSN